MACQKAQTVTIMMIAVVLMPITSPPDAHQTDSQRRPGKDASDEPVKYHGRYTNIDYGFSVEIPTGLTGEGNVPDAPNHGFTIQLREKSVVRVDASYENAPDSPYPFGRFNALLGPLKAERKSWREDKGGVKWLHYSIAARAFDRGTPIIYTIQLDTTSEHQDEAVSVFEALVSSFRKVRVRP